MTLLYTAAAVRELDRRAIEDEGIPGIVLMRRAAAACVEEITLHVEQPVTTVLCGSGNNAGDGYIIAGMLAERGCQVAVINVGDVNKLGPDATEAYRYCEVSAAEFTDTIRDDSEVIVDALLGIGITGEVRPAYAEAIARINEAGAEGALVLAVDVPSGLSADTGRVLGAAVEADITVTFIGRKRGLYTADGPDRAGDIVFADLDVPPVVYRDDDDSVAVIEHEPLPIRPQNSHKNTFGHVLVVGGNTGMGGAILMAAEAALRAGAGLVSVATRPEHVMPMLNRCPEVMSRGVASAGDIKPMLEKASVCVVGPGLGTDDWARSILEAVLATDLPLVVDADGLNLTATMDVKRDNWVLTPHPGEAQRMLSTAIDDRFDAVTQLQKNYGGAVVLKGCGSLVADQDSVSLCVDGNPGMAAAGMGDVLSGVVGAYLAQTGDPGFAARQGVVVHAMAGDIAAEDGMAGLMATDLLAPIRALTD